MQPTAKILYGPTPLQPAPRLSDRLGIELWIKRDDLAGPTVGGNKSRQLEYYIGAAVAEGADTLLITGAVQSNFSRIAAATARMHGLEPVVQREERVAGASGAARRSGNVLLSDILGAEVLDYPEGEDEAGADAALDRRADALRAEGRKPYVIHLGAGQKPLGALGYVDAAREMLGQADGFDFYIVGSGSGATHSGLLAGLRAEGAQGRVIGACVRRPAPVQAARIAGIIGRLGDIFAPASRVRPEDIETWDGAFAPGYGRYGASVIDAMKLMARHEGLHLDPVYTAKSFAAIPALVADGTIPAGARVCFVHTGGLAGLFAYADTLTEFA